MKKCLVIGGTGFLGQAVLRRFHEKNIPGNFTFYKNSSLAQSTSEQTGYTAIKLDLRHEEFAQTLFEKLKAQSQLPNVLICCAGTLAPESEDISSYFNINARSILSFSELLCQHWRDNQQNGDIVFVGIQGKGKSFKMPKYFSQAQGLLAGGVKYLFRDFGSNLIRINLINIGLLEAGISTSLDSNLKESFSSNNAVKRLGSANEVSQAIAWLATENSYANGKTIAVNGGL